MRKGFVILTLGLMAATLAYGCFYLMGTQTTRNLLDAHSPELAWLKHEFDLSDEEFEAVVSLHWGYLPLCRERCRRIEELNTQLSNTLASAVQVTTDMETLLAERAQVRAACQTDMMRHFFEVSQAMPAEQGKRYLAWVWEHTCLRERDMDHGMAEDHAVPIGPDPPG